MTPDELLIAVIVAKARENADSQHLRQCPELMVTQADGSDGSYGCDTGCDYARLEARLSCPHGETEWYFYGEFGDLASLIEDMQATWRARAGVA